MITYTPVCENDPVALAISALPDWLLRAPWLHITLKNQSDHMGWLLKQAPRIGSMPTRFATKVGRAAEPWPDCLPPMVGPTAPVLHSLELAAPEPYDVDALWPMGPTQAGWRSTPTRPPAPVREFRLRSCTERRRLALVAFDVAHPELVGVDCHVARDGECNWATCPQNLEGEPRATGRHCPLDRYDDE